MAYLSLYARDQEIRDILAPPLKSNSAETYPPVLLLKNNYDNDVLAKSGTAALTGVDLSRLQTIEKLNAVLAPNNQLQFFAVKLDHEMESVWTGCSEYDDGLDKDHKDSIAWHTLGSKDQTLSRDPYTYADLHLEYLKPDDKPLRDMWLKAEPVSHVTMPSDEDSQRYADRMRSRIYEEYDDPPLPTKHEKYFRQGILILPCERAMEIIRKFSGDKAAAAYLQQYSPRDSAALRSLLTNGDYHTKEWNDAVCQSLVEIQDTALVDLFFREVANIFCTAMRVNISSAVLTLVRGFGWEAIQAPFLSSYACGKCTNQCSDSTVFGRLVSLLKRAGPDSYGSMIQRLEKYAADVGFSSREQEAFSDLVAARVQYLKAAVTNRGKPGVWSIPQACVPGEPEVEEFLRGPERSKAFTCFPDKKAARAFMSKFTDDNCASMFSMDCRADNRCKVCTDCDADEILTQARARRGLPL